MQIVLLTKSKIDCTVGTGRYVHGKELWRAELHRAFFMFTYYVQVGGEKEAAAGQFWPLWRPFDEEALLLFSSLLSPSTHPHTPLPEKAALESGRRQAASKASPPPGWWL